jgi:transcription antitermination factor NusG
VTPDAEYVRPTICGAIDIASEISGNPWYAVYTAPRHEKFVHALLAAQEIDSFLPLYTTERKWKNGVRREIQFPLLPGYVFVRLGGADWPRVLRTSGVLRIIGVGRSPLPLDDLKMRALRAGGQYASLMPHQFRDAGDLVCITRGALRGVEGYVEESEGSLLFVVNIHLIQRSFAIPVAASGLELAG